MRTIASLILATTTNTSNVAYGCYAGIDLHTRTLYLYVLDADWRTRVHQNLKCQVDRLEHVLEPFREDLVVGW